MSVSKIPPPDLPTTERSWVPVKVAGEIDIATVSGVLGTVLGASKAGTAGIVVDVSGVTFMGAAGINIFVVGRNQQREKGQDLMLRSPSPFLLRVLEICDLGDVVEPPAVAEV
jgi:anti-sigma B factor antagonist